MTPEVVFGTIAAVSTVASMLMGGGLFRQYIKHSNDQAVTKYILEETQKKLEKAVSDIAALQTKSVEVNTKIEQFNEHIKKLELIPRLDEKLNAMETLISSVNDTVQSLFRERHAE